MKTELYNKLVEISDIKTTKIKSVNLKVGVNAYNVIGNYTSDANAIPSEMELGSSGYVNAVKIDGVLPVHTNKSIGLLPIGSAIANDISNNMEMTFHSNVVVNIDNSSIDVQDTILKNSAVLSVPYDVMANALNINPLHIRKDVSVLSVVGNYDASTEFSGVKLEPIEFSSSQIPLLNLITEISNLDMNLGTNLYGYFSSLPKLIYVSNIAMPNITSGSSLFSSDVSLQYISNINMYNDTTINSVPLADMFLYCYNLVSINNDCKFPKSISWANSMFYMCNNLKYVNIPIHFENTTRIYNAFTNCSSLEDFSNFIFDYDNSKCFNTLSFSNCTNINLHTVHNVNWLNCTNPGLLLGCSNVTADDIEACMPNGVYVASHNTFSGTGINRIPNIPYTTNLKTASNLFKYCSNLDVVNLGTNFFNNFPAINNLMDMFYGCGNLTSLDLDFGNLRIKSIYGLARYCTNLNSLNVGGMYLSSIPELVGYSNNVRNVNILLNSSTWDCDLSRTFVNCFSLENINIDDYSGDFNIGGNLFNLYYTFANCSNLVNISHLDYILSNIGYFSNTFRDCTNLKINGQLDINVLDMDADYGDLFYDCPNVTANANVYIHYNNIRETQHINVFRYANVPHVNIVCNGTIRSKSTASYIGSFIVSCHNLKTLNSSFDINSSCGTSFSVCESCYNVTDINVDIAINSLYNVTMSEFLLSCYNLVNLNINLISNNFKVPSFKIAGCPNLSNESLDNILGFLVNINMINPSYKTLNNMGLNTYSNTIWETLPNYANFINAGYSVGY